MLNNKNTYRLLIGITLLLFTQVLMPYLHNHSEKHHAYGINVSSDEACMICSFDIIPADFIIPTVFTFFTALLLHRTLTRVWSAETIIFSILQQGRGPPTLV